MPPTPTGSMAPAGASVSAPPAASLGLRLRLERERRRITLDSIAANTKINIVLLQGLERDDVSRWPSGIFRRSFIRDYAVAVGLDPDETMREFVAQFPDPEFDVPAATKAPAPADLRLMLDGDDSSPARGNLPAEAVKRIAAVALDVVACLSIAAGLFATFGEWWRPLAVTVIGYYASGVVLFGEPPGVFFFVHSRRANLRLVLKPPASAKPTQQDTDEARRALRQFISSSTY